MRRVQIGIAVVAGIVFMSLFFGRLFPNVFVLEFYMELASGIAQQGVNASVERQAGFDETETAFESEALSAQTEERLDGLVTIEDVQPGTGKEAVVGSTVSLGYIGMTKDESGSMSVFDETGPERPLTFTVGDGRMIAGFDTGVRGMREGGRRSIRIKPEAAYGDQERPGIPANSTLTFLVELYEVQ